ncbi:MAG: hypothetical protein K8U03_23450 [Planctomycetia bacterium]|nr:hypothetical protein [Planctomycetia bacterium]
MEFDPSSFLKLLLVGAVTTTLLVRLHIARRKQQLREAQPVGEGSRVRDAYAPPETLRWQTEIHDFTRDVQARLDNKIAMLQQLLSAADERIARLEAMETRRLQGAPRMVPGETVDETARYAAVFAMANAGNGPTTIADRLGMPLGEIEMMLSLRRRIPDRLSA